MMEFLFLDLDDTILDFHKAERIALGKTLLRFGVEPTEEVLARYHVINRQHWEMLERQELTREQVLVGRFRVLLEELGRRADPAEVALVYEGCLGVGHYFLPGAQEAVIRLSRRYRLFLASNGTASVQRSRIASAGLEPYFERVFISQDVGWDKPAREFFQACFREIPGFAGDKALMVGDSLTSDILGGIRAGIKTCWVSPGSLPAGEEIRPDYQIPALSRLEALLETL